jgi:restriction system protein
VEIPDFQTMMRPVLDALSGGQPRSVQEIRADVAQVLAVSDAQQQELLPSGKQTTFSNRVAWALTHMSHAGLVTRPVRGSYAITDRGREVLMNNRDRVDMGVLNQFEEYVAFRTIKQVKGPPLAPPPADEVSPSEAIGAIIAGSEAELAKDLLDRVLAQPPSFLERLALRVLREMGYGGREFQQVEHTGQPGDAGLDGLVRQDALGLDVIGVQAKRYDLDNPVQRPALQAFVGALQGAQTNRGVFVTTGRFTPGAQQFARSVAMQLILIDGEELARLMVRYNVGVQVRESFELKHADEEFFEEL